MFRNSLVVIFVCFQSFCFSHHSSMLIYEFISFCSCHWFCPFTAVHTRVRASSIIRHLGWRLLLSNFIAAFLSKKFPLFRINLFLIDSVCLQNCFPVLTFFRSAELFSIQCGGVSSLLVCDSFFLSFHSFSFGVFFKNCLFLCIELKIYPSNSIFFTDFN